jgi:hypothetical protein
MVEIKHKDKLPGNDNFILAHQVEHVYYLKYPCEKLAAWWVVYKVNPHEWLYIPTDAAYHFDDEHVDEIYQEEELPTSFVVEPATILDSLVGDGVDVTVLQKRKQQPVKKKRTRWSTLEWRRQLCIDPDEFWQVNFLYYFYAKWLLIYFPTCYFCITLMLNDYYFI